MPSYRRPSALPLPFPLRGLGAATAPSASHDGRGPGREKTRDGPSARGLLSDLGVARWLGALLVFLLGFASVGFWLTRRPLSWEARQAELAASPTRPAVAQPPSLNPEAPPPALAATMGPVVAEPADEKALAVRADIRPTPPTRRAPSPSFDRTDNYLFVGVDHTRGRGFGRADTLMLAVFDGDSGHVGFVSIPRDLYVEIEDYGPARINSTLRVGATLRKDPLELMRRVTSDALAVPIQQALVVDLERFEQGIDRLGGLTIDVPCAIEDNFIDPRTPSGRRLLLVAAGRQQMDGVTAAMYARSRHGRSDWDRARRQQALLLAMRDRASELGLQSWLPIALEAIEEGVTTTMSRLEMLSLARRVAGIERDRLHGLVIGTRQTTLHRTDEGQAVLIPDYAAIDTHLRGLFSAPAPGVRPVHKECPDAGVAIP